MPPKIKTLAQLEHSLTGVFGGRDDFSAEALEHFPIFLDEAKLMDQGRTLVESDKFHWLDPVYQLTRSALLGVKDENGHWLQRPQFPEGIVMRKASQMGASTFSVAHMIWLAIDRSRPLSIGCYWPTQRELQVFITSRLNPMLEHSPKLASYLKDAKFDNTEIKQIGRSTLYFRHVAGATSMDSQPMDIIYCDEIRLWPNAADALQRIDERMGQSDIRLRFYMSTVGSPEDFMEQRWFESNQLKFFTHCPSGCATEISRDPRTANRTLHPADFSEGQRYLPGVVLSDFDPEKIVVMTARRQASYRCPCCGEHIPDQTVGRFEETRPEAHGMLGLEFARTLSPRTSAWELLNASRTATDLKQFMNGWMAKPFLDPEGRPVREEHWASARLRGGLAGLGWDGWGADTVLGADFRTNEMHVVIGQLGEFQAQGLTFPGRISHVEVYQGAEWEERLDQLMLQFGVSTAVIDYMPDSTGTLKYAKRHEGQVLLAEYRPGDLMRLGADRKKSTRQVSPDGREEYKISLDQVKSLMASLKGFSQGQWLLPDAPLYQEHYFDRLKGEHPLFDVMEGMEGKGREGFKQHLMCLALETVAQEKKNEAGESVVISGVTSQQLYDAGGFDPHWAHAFNYMVMASRVGGGGATLLRPSEDAVRELETRMAQAGGAATSRLNLATFAPGGSGAVRRALRLCGGCLHGPVSGRAMCEWSGMDVGAEEPACGLTPGWRARR